MKSNDIEERSWLTHKKKNTLEVVCVIPPGKDGGGKKREPRKTTDCELARAKMPENTDNKTSAGKERREGN